MNENVNEAKSIEAEGPEERRRNEQDALESQEVAQSCGQNAVNSTSLNEKEDIISISSGQHVKTKQEAVGWMMGDVLVYVTVINLFVEWVPKMEMESFTISIVTAIVLKIVLEGVHFLQHKFKHFFCQVRGDKRYCRLLGAFFIWLVLFGSKFLIFWIDQTLFPNKVYLGGVKWILVLSIVLMVFEKLMRVLWVQLGMEDRRLTMKEALQIAFH